MSIFKCKMCGGDIEVSADKSFGTCECCGSQMTFPKIDDEQKLATFNRGNAFRRSGEFDKALSLYENIVREDDSDAEAHWCCALCRFGIEYVEDPASFEYVPTCHRASFDSFLDDVDYLAAIEHADGITKRQYQKEAVRIADIQKRILATSQNEDPFDVFICYKETDDTTGQRTKDSIDAQDIYYQLTNEGYRVFFSRITLEDKVGVEYEPYIFAALNSSKVMIVIGSKAEYFNAVWVKNEWSRFLALMRKDRSKLLLPCYKNISPYDLPEQLSILQSYDMAKIGFIQDLIHGIKKITIVDEPTQSYKETVINNSVNFGSNIRALLDRGFMALEDGEFDKADDFFENALNIDAKNAECYLGKLMAELKVKSKEELKNCKDPFDNNNNCIKASKFSSEISEKLKADNTYIRNRNDSERKEEIYNIAISKMTKAHSEADYSSAAYTFGTITGYKDADAKHKECLEKAEVARKDAIYNSAKSKMAENNETAYKYAIRLFESIIDWKDSKTKIDECNKKIEDIHIAEKKAFEELKRQEREAKIAKEKAEEERKCKEDEARIATEKAKAKKKKITMIISSIVAVVIVFFVVFFVVLNTVILPASNYKKAIAALDAGNYDEAISMFNNNPEYKDTDELIEKCYVGKYGEEKWKIMKPFTLANVGEKVAFGKYEQDNITSNSKEDIEWRVLAKNGKKLLIISEKALDCKQYNTEHTDITWETCSLRKWLNGTFYKVAFSSLEQSMIKSTKVTSDTNPRYGTNAGNDTNDKVFLLSITEVNKYFSSDEDRNCVPTAYATENGAYTSLDCPKDDEATCVWLLRSPGVYSDDVAFVYEGGVVGSFGLDVDNNCACVRPALWIEI